MSLWRMLALTISMGGSQVSPVYAQDITADSLRSPGQCTLSGQLLVPARPTNIV